MRRSPASFGAMTWSKHSRRIEPICRFVEFFSVARVAIAKQIAKRTVPRKSFQQLPARPFCRGVGSYGEMNRTPAIMGENHKNKRWNVIVGTMKKSAETKLCMWLFRNVRQFCDGGLRCRTKS
jgi:hypothetical protein